MSNENQSGRRRGPRHRRPSRGGGERSATVPASSPSLLQRILGFFGLGPKKKSYPAYPGGAGGGGNGAARGSSGLGSDSRGRRGAEESALSGAEGGGSPSPRPARKPEAVEVTTPKLYVGNLSFDATESDLSELFNGVGGVRNVEIVTHRDTEKSKGFGFVTMNSVDEAKRAVTELNEKEFMGRRLVVSGSKTNDRVAA
jgi:hypothetical protein